MRRFQTVTFAPLFIYYIAWRGDGSNPFFEDPVVRRALSLALDREGYVNSVMRGAGRIADSPFHHSILAPADRPAAPPFDPSKAADLLDSAGWSIDPGTGLRTRNGVPFRFDLLVFSGGQDHVRFSQVAQESLRRLGIEMSIQRLDWPTLWGRLKNGDFEAALSGMVSGLDPDSLYGMLHSSQIEGGQNYAAFDDAAVDAWLEEGRRNVDPEQRRDRYTRVDRRLRELQPYAFLFYPVVRAVVPRRFEGIVPSPLGVLNHYPGVSRIRALHPEAR